MEGKRQITWIFDWLGLGSMGQQYEVLPSVQPVAFVDAMEMPPRYQFAAASVPHVAGSMEVVLPQPTNQLVSRLWTGLWFNRSAVAAGDGQWFYRTINNNPASLLWASQDPILTANRSVPVIGGIEISSQNGTQILIERHGVRPCLATATSGLAFHVITVAAAGNFNWSGQFLDIPASAPIFQEWQ